MAKWVEYAAAGMAGAVAGIAAERAIVAIYKWFKKPAPVTKAPRVVKTQPVTPQTVVKAPVRIVTEDYLELNKVAFHAYNPKDFSTFSGCLNGIRLFTENARIADQVDLDKMLVEWIYSVCVLSDIDNHPELIESVQDHLHWVRTHFHGLYYKFTRNTPGAILPALDEFGRQLEEVFDNAYFAATRAKLARFG